MSHGIRLSALLAAVLLAAGCGGSGSNQRRESAGPPGDMKSMTADVQSRPGTPRYAAPAPGGSAGFVKADAAGEGGGGNAGFFENLGGAGGDGGGSGGGSGGDDLVTGTVMLDDASPVVPALARGAEIGKCQVAHTEQDKMAARCHNGVIAIIQNGREISYGCQSITLEQCKQVFRYILDNTPTRD